MADNTMTFVVGFLFVLLFGAFVFVTTFYHPARQEMGCSDPNVSINGVCCLDTDSDFVCDNLGVIQLKSSAQLTKQVITCEKPYIRSSDACCLDSDGSSVCDSAESVLFDNSSECGDCDDGDSCTYDVCINDQCHNFCQIGRKCDDGNPLTLNDACNSKATGRCGCYGVAVECRSDLECNDFNPCTKDVCVNNFCQRTCVIGAQCDDSNPKTSESRCSLSYGSCLCLSSDI